jgi:hypothetical protein
MYFVHFNCSVRSTFSELLALLAKFSSSHALDEPEAETHFPNIPAFQWGRSSYVFKPPLNRKEKTHE